MGSQARGAWFQDDGGIQMPVTATTLTYRTQVDVTEVITTNDDSLSDALVRHSTWNTAHVLSAGSTPPVTKVAAFVATLTSNLAALVGTNGATVVGTGLKVQAIKLQADAENGAVITITKGASNGYGLVGAGTSIALLPGQECVIYGNDATPDVASDARVLDLVGTGSSDHLHVTIVLG
jgi:hypothetical protein